MTTDVKMRDMTMAPGVVDTIIAIAVDEVEGVMQIGTAPGRGIRNFFAPKQSTAGIETEFGEDGKLAITLHLEVAYGYVLPELAAKIRSAVADALLVQAGVEVSYIDIYVDGIRFEQAS